MRGLKEKRGQVGTEFLIIVGFVIVVMVPITIMYIQYSGQSSDTVTASKAEHITNEIAAAASSVFAYGEGSQTKLTLDFPSNIKEIKFEGNEVIFIVINSQSLEQEIVQVTDVEFMGDSNIYVMPGKKDIIVKTVYDPISGTNKVSVTMPCTNGEIRCCTSDEKGPMAFLNGYDCSYKCENSVWTLKTLCDPGTCSGSFSTCTTENTVDCESLEGTCVSVYNGICGEPAVITGICSSDPLKLCCVTPEFGPVDECDTLGETICNDIIGETCPYTPQSGPYLGNTFIVDVCEFICVNNGGVNTWEIYKFCDICSDGDPPCSFDDPDTGPDDCLGSTYCINIDVTQGLGGISEPNEACDTPSVPGPFTLCCNPIS